MNPTVRSLLAYLSVCGFVGSAAVYIMGFNESTAEYARLVFLPLFIVLFLVGGIFYVMEYRSLKDFAWWKGIPRFMSPRAVLLQRLLAVGAVAHVAWSVWQSRRGVPAFIDGQYVLESNGKCLSS